MAYTTEKKRLYMVEWRKRFRDAHGISENTARQRRSPKAKATADRARAVSKASHRELWHAIRDNACVDCGVKYPPCAMDFDHVRGEKKYNMAQLFTGGYSIALIMRELEKCELVCSNCHRARTYNRKQKSQKAAA